MKIVLLIMLFLPSLFCFSESYYVDECSDSFIEEIKEIDLVLFNKKELVQLGKCIAKNRLKSYQSINKLSQACAEVTEDRTSSLGVMVLSKAEAIQIGVCIGAIQYIHDKYDEYNCKKGILAIKQITLSTKQKYDRVDLQKILCWQ